MNDHDRFEQTLADLLAERGADQPAASRLDEALLVTAATRQSPRWMALLTESPMHVGTSVAAGSPAVRLAAIAVVTALMLALTAGALVGGSALLGPITVDADGSGDYRTISEAVDAARDGDTIEVNAGHYIEDVRVVGKDLTIRGVGPREDIIVEAAPAERPAGIDSRQRGSRDFRGAAGLIVRGEYARAFLLRRTSTTLANMTVVGQAEGSSIEIIGTDADPVLSGLHLPFVGNWEFDHAAIWWAGGASGSLRESRVAGAIEIDSGSTPRLTDNVLEACLYVAGDATHPVIDGNRIFDCPFGFLVSLNYGTVAATISGNDLSIANDLAPVSTDFASTGIWTWNDSDATLTIDDNDFHDAGQAISLGAGSAATIKGNRFERHETALVIAADDAEIRGNTIRDSDIQGLSVLGSPTIADNIIEGNTTGIFLGRNSSAVVTNNHFCGNDFDTRVAAIAGSGTPTVGDNEVCADDTG